MLVRNALAVALLVISPLANTTVASVKQSENLIDRVEHGYADSDGVKIHYASLGEGPLVVMIHGFPDFWYSWRDQMEALAGNFRVVAIDQRGYNLSDKPASRRGRRRGHSPSGSGARHRSRA